VRRALEERLDAAVRARRAGPPRPLADVAGPAA
jgi:hypothetical protein